VPTCERRRVRLLPDRLCCHTRSSTRLLLNTSMRHGVFFELDLRTSHWRWTVDRRPTAKRLQTSRGSRSDIPCCYHNNDNTNNNNNNTLYSYHWCSNQNTIQYNKDTNIKVNKHWNSEKQQQNVGNKITNCRIVLDYPRLL
jgi:hypothetical protein